MGSQKLIAIIINDLITIAKPGTFSTLSQMIYSMCAQKFIVSQLIKLVRIIE